MSDCGGEQNIFRITFLLAGSKLGRTREAGINFSLLYTHLYNDQNCLLNDKFTQCFGQM